MTRAEHLQCCKDRALEYIHDGDISGGIASMLSDLRKHPETENHVAIGLCMLMLARGQLNSKQKAEKFIIGFN